MAKINFKNLTPKISQLFDRDKLKTPLKPYRDWAILLTVFFLILIILSAGNVYLFKQINKKRFFTKETSIRENVEMLNTEVLTETIGLFNKKTEEFEKLRNQKPDVVDPSL